MLTYEIYRNDLSDVGSKSLVDPLVSISKEYTVSLVFYAALADRRPELEDAMIMRQYSFKDDPGKTLEDVRSAARKGRENR